MEKLQEKVLVVFSGGQDSTTCLMMALSLYEKVETISFDYGQKHKIELDCAYKICQKYDVPFKVIKTGIFERMGNSALLHSSSQDVCEKHTHDEKLPASFVPGRNLYFLTIAAMHAYKQGITKIFTGVSEEDYSGYPDCRESTIQSLELALQAGMDYPIQIITPFIHKTKVQEIQMAKTLPNGMEALALSHTCYNGQFPPCGECPSCKLRAKAFKEANIIDPLVERANNIKENN